MPRLRIDDALELVPLTLEDADELFVRVAQNRQHLARWLPWAATATLEGTFAFVRDSLRRAEVGDGFDLAIRESGRLVGLIGLQHVDRLNHATSVGYWLAHDARGRGIATRACAALIDHCFGEMQLHRVEIRIAPENEKSLAVAKRLGAREEGRAREAALLLGRWEDLLILGVLSHEWSAR